MYYIYNGANGTNGTNGATGSQGPAGNNGKSILYGNGAPSNAIGVDGEFFINTVTNYIYGPKASGVWPSGVSLVGPQGPQGIQGIQGIQGATGIQGPVGLQGPAGAKGDTGELGPGRKVWRQSSQPNVSTQGPFNEGDIWFDTDDDNRLYIYTGTAWADVKDTSIAAAKAAADAAQTSANGKNRVFRQSTTPTALAVGDIWFNSGSGNRPKQWDGTTWVDFGLGYQAIDSIDANTISTGYLAAARIQAGTIDASKITAGTITTDLLAANAVVASKIAAGSITGDRLSANAIDAFNIAGAYINGAVITGGTVTGANLQTNSSGRRVVISSSTNSISFAGSSGSVIGQMLGDDNGSLLIHYGSTPSTNRSLYPYMYFANGVVSIAASSAASLISMSSSDLTVTGLGGSRVNIKSGGSPHVYLGNYADTGRVYLGSGGGTYINDDNDSRIYVRRNNVGTSDITSTNFPLQIGNETNSGADGAMRFGMRDIQSYYHNDVSKLTLNPYGGEVWLGTSPAASDLSNLIAPYVYQDVRAGLSANISVLSGGRIVRAGSTQKLKSNISSLYTNALSDSVLPEKIQTEKEFDYKKVLSLSPVSFHSINPNEDSSKIHLGFIAEDIADKAPELASYSDDGLPEYYNLNGIVAALLAVVQEQQDRIKALEERL